MPGKLVEEFHVLGGLGLEEVPSDQWAVEEKVKSKLVERLEEVLCGLLEALVGLVVQGAFVFDKSQV